MDNLANTYRHIADILSFQTPNSKLEQILSNPTFDWDSLVKEGSKHYVIPAIYCRLKSKQLLDLLPKELINYLEYITGENRKRNDEILIQIQKISQLFKTNHIEYVFLKGSALLILGCYEDNAERMLGDIDILVKESQLNEAYQLLKDNNYQSIELTLGNDFFEHKHLPRLKTSQDIAAVEVHRKLFVSYKYNPLKAEYIFKEKLKKKDTFIPSHKHLLMHNILNFQINDKGALYNSISFRSAYDTIVLQRINIEPREWYTDRFFKNYFRITSLFFNEIKVATKIKSNVLTSFYLFKLKHQKFYKYWNIILKLFSFFPILTNRIWVFISNKTYRKAIIKDRNRIYSHFISILNKN